MKKVFNLLFAFFAVIFVSCSDLISSADTSDVSFSIDTSSLSLVRNVAARGASFDDIAYTLQLELSGGYSYKLLKEYTELPNSIYLKIPDVPIGKDVTLYMGIFDANGHLKYQGQTNFTVQQKNKITLTLKENIKEIIDSEGALFTCVASSAAVGVSLSFNGNAIVSAIDDFDDIESITITRKGSDGDTHKFVVSQSENSGTNLASNRGISFTDQNVVESVEYTYTAVIADSDGEKRKISKSVTPASGNGPLSFEKQLAYLDVSKDIMFPPIVYSSGADVGSSGSFEDWFSTGYSNSNGSASTFFDFYVAEGEDASSACLELYYTDATSYCSNLYAAAYNAGLDTSKSYVLKSVAVGYKYDTGSYVVKEYASSYDDVTELGLVKNLGTLEYPILGKSTDLISQGKVGL